MRAAVLAAGLAAAAAGAAAAHPHVFVDAGVELQFDAAGLLQAVRIVWVYDDFTSLMILADRNLDPGPQDRLDAAALAALTGFDMNWVEGFEGDSRLLAGDAAVPLGPPERPTADYVQGRIVTSHIRRLAEPVDPAAAPVVLKLYDPTYYTAYTIAAAPVVAGRGDCTAEVWGPDLGAASAQLEAALAELAGAGGDAEADFPPLGAAFAEEVRLTCPARR